MATGQTAGMQHFPQPDGLPPANGYSHAVAFTGRLVVISGQVPAGPDGQVVGAGDPAAQVRQVFTNLATALAAAGATLAQVVKLTIFLTDLADLAVLREVRDEFLAAAARRRPTRCVVPGRGPGLDQPGRGPPGGCTTCRTSAGRSGPGTG